MENILPLWEKTSFWNTNRKSQKLSPSMKIVGNMKVHPYIIKGSELLLFLNNSKEK